MTARHALNSALTVVQTVPTIAAATASRIAHRVRKAVALTARLQQTVALNVVTVLSAATVLVATTVLHAVQLLVMVVAVATLRRVVQVALVKTALATVAAALMHQQVIASAPSAAADS